MVDAVIKLLYKHSLHGFCLPALWPYVRPTSASHARNFHSQYR